MTSGDPGRAHHAGAAERADATADPHRSAPGPLAFREMGAPTGDPLVLVHGFTQTSRCWAPFDERLAASHRLLLVDAPGHGASGHDLADLGTAAALLGATAGPATYLGYSMGGRIALRLALDAPHLVRRLVLIGASPGLDDEAERSARRASDDALADRIERIGVDAFLDEWLGLALFAGLTPERAHRAERRVNRAAGLAGSLRAMGTGAQEPAWARLDALAVPVLLVVGAEDHKFAGVAHAMAARIGRDATVAEVDGAGHTAHLEQPERTAAIVLRWLRDHPVHADPPGDRAPR